MSKNAVQEPGTTPKVRGASRQRKDLAGDVRGVEPGDGRRQASRAREAGAQEAAEKEVTVRACPSCGREDLEIVISRESIAREMEFRRRFYRERIDGRIDPAM